MKIFTKTNEIIEFRRQQSHLKIGFVPTMGALHEGHLQLIKQSLADNDFTYVSIFVNPLQFNDKKDFEKYPVTTDEDIKALESIHTNALFLPSVDEVYHTSIEPDNIDLTYLNSILEGPKRPGHFEGVVKVVSILFKIIRPHKAYFGLKDYQQVKVIQQLVNQKKYEIEIVSCPTVREPNGLAMSSRNKRLSEEGRKKASQIYRWLSEAKELYHKGIEINEIVKIITQKVQNNNDFVLDYFEIRDKEDLSEITLSNQRPVALMAVYLEGVRLIDNLEF